MLQTVLNEAAGKADIVLVQEPPSRPLHPLLHYHRWICLQGTVSVPHHRHRALIFITESLSKQHNIQRISEISDEDVVAISIDNRVTLINVYNQIPQQNRRRENGLHDTLFRLYDKITTYPNVVLAGDMNVHHSLWDRTRRYTTHAWSNRLVEYMEINQLTVVNDATKPTHLPHNGSSPSIIDLIITSESFAPGIAIDPKYLEHGSDHLTIPWTLWVPDTESPPTSSKLNFRRTNWEAVKEDLPEIWPSVQRPYTPNSIDESVAHFTKTSLSIIKEHTPKPRQSQKRSPYWSAEVKAALKFLQACRSIHRDKLVDNSRALLCYARRNHRKAVQLSMDTHTQTVLESANSDNIWQTYRTVLRGGVKGDPPLPSLETDQGTMAVTPEDKRKVFRSYFFPPSTSAHAFPSPNPYAPRIGKADKNWPPVSAEELVDTISAINPNKAPGPDFIPPKFLRAIGDHEPTLVHLASIFTACLQIGYHPMQWRTSITTAIPKPASPSKPRDYAKPKAYRPISLLPTPGKALERIVDRRIRYLTYNKIHPHQLGARQGCNAHDLIHTFLYDVQLHKSRASNPAATSALLVDIQGAFDHVDKYALLRSLRKLNLPQALLRWIWSFMSDRKVSINIQGKCDDAEPANMGLPQGSPLSPLLFILYTRNIFDILPKDCNVLGYMDDYTIYVHGDPATNAKKLQKAFETLQIWAKDLHLEFDMGDKLELIHFPITTSDPSNSTIWNNSTQKAIQPRNEVKLVGYTLTKNLSWDRHATERLEKGLKLIGILKQLASRKASVSAEIGRLLYLTMIRPILEYGCTTYNKPKINSNILQKLESVQHRSLCIAASAPHASPTKAIQVDMGVAPLHENFKRRRYQYIVRVAGLAADHPTRIRLRKSNFKTSLGIAKAQLKRLGVDITQIPAATAPPAPWDKVPPDRDATQPPQKSSDDPSPNAKIQQTLITKWEHYFNKCEKGSFYKSHTPSPIFNEKLARLPLREELQKASRSQLRTIFQFRSGQVPLNYQRSKDSDDVSPRCPLCPCPSETIQHWLFDCPARQMSRTVFSPLPEQNIQTVLNTAEGRRALISYYNQQPDRKRHNER